MLTCAKPCRRVEPYILSCHLMSTILMNLAGCILSIWLWAMAVNRSVPVGLAAVLADWSDLPASARVQMAY